MGIPSAQLFQRGTPKVEGRPAQRNGQAKPGESRQHDPEPGCKFNGETSRQPFLTRIVVVEDSLKAHDLWRGGLKPARHLRDLVRIG